MNVKFRMPRLGKKIVGQSMLKEMTMTFIATTISIILTFGSAAIVEKRQKEQNRRQTVMMVIHDIENNIKVLKSWKECEEKQITLTHYVLNHIDQIDSIPLDTLKYVYDYLIEDENGLSFVLDNSIEKLFQENQSLWSSLDDNMEIIDQVQLFFNERHSKLEELNNSSFWKYPISKLDNLAYLCEGSKNGYPLNIKRVLRAKLDSPRVQFFLQYSPNRQMSYDQIVDDWQKKSDRLKFMIGVTDEELVSFIEAHEKLGRIATENDIIGEWVRVDSMEGRVNYFFESDKTFNIRYRDDFKNSIYTGMIIGIRSFEGTWAYKGDTLVESFNPQSFGYCMDMSRIQYNKMMRDSIFLHLDVTPEQQNGMMRDSVNSYIQEIKNCYEEIKKNIKKGYVEKYLLRIDESGNKIEVSYFEDTNKEPYVYYLKRKIKKE